MISIDNAVELSIKTYLGLPRRARGSKGPSRKELDTASESFPALLDLLQSHAADKLVGLSLDDIEWYHRLRNQLYHSGNGITVEMAKVETYLELATALFESLFDVPPAITHVDAVRTKTGHFLEIWTAFERSLRDQLPPKQGPAYYWKREFLEKVSTEARVLFDRISIFRNQLVHGFDQPTPEQIDQAIGELRQLAKMLKINVA